NEPNVNASRAKRTARNHDPLALVASTYASPSYSWPSQSNYVTHPPSVQDYDDDYQGDIHRLSSVDIQVIECSWYYTGISIRNAGVGSGNLGGKECWECDHEQQKHAKLETIKPTSVDDQLDSNMMFDDPYVEVNGEQTKHVHDAHDQKVDDFESLIKNAQIEAKNQRMVNKEMKIQNTLLAKELETYKKCIRDFENKPVNNNFF
ncbi:hypothetical protein Tco_1335348, partial [Tanacetum coccineum]